MKRAEDIERVFQKAGLGIGPDADERVFADVLQARRQTPQNPRTVFDRGRTIMKSPFTKVAVAATIVVACAIGLSLWRTTGSGIALADVLARVEEAKTYSFQSDDTMTDEDLPFNNGETHTRTLRSQEYGTRTISETRDPNGRVDTVAFYWRPQTRILTTLRPQKKKYARTEFDEAWAQRIEDSYNNVRQRLKRLLACKHESLGRSNVDGIEVEGFRTTDPNYANDFEARQVEVNMWVDVKTELPVRFEENLAFARMRMHTATYDYRWDVPAPASEFDPVIPNDYTPVAGGVAKWPALTEEVAIQGLKLCIELLGKYPEQTQFYPYQSSAFEKSDTPAALRLKEEIKGLGKDEQANRLVEARLPMLCLSRFYSGLQFDKKDPAYYGKTVTPKDGDKVLLRWKVSGKEYRVIFGDLHAETVSPETLAELEKGLSR